MVTDYTEDLIKYSAKLQELSKKYATERYKFGQNEGDLMLILASKIKGYMEAKKNIGIDMAMLKLVGEADDKVKKMYCDMKKSYNNYKALEKLIDAQSSAIMTIQSIMKYNKTGEFTSDKGGEHEENRL